MSASPSPETRFKQTRILFFALWSTVFVYMGIATLLANVHVDPPQQPELAHDPFSHPLVIALTAIGVLILALTPLARTKLMPPRSYGGTKLEVPAALSRLLVAQLAAWALTEVVAVFGLILSLLSYEPRFVYAFGGVAALVMLAYAPSRRVHDEVVRVATP